MKRSKIFTKNMNFFMAMLIVIILSVLGITLAITIASSKNIGIKTTAAPIDVIITYDNSVNGSSVVSVNNLLPINDSMVTGVNVADSRVLKVKFAVAGVSSNPKNSIYDIALRDLVVDCQLKTEEVKWRLYKNGSLLSSGNLSPTFDTMENNRLVLTEIQQDLTTTKDEYVFLLWISENCIGDISSCLNNIDQSVYLNRTFTGNIKVELSSKTKKELERPTSAAIDPTTCS